MGFTSFLKGAFRKLIGKDTVGKALDITPIVSDRMREAIELWESMYKNESPWLNDNTHSLGLAQLIASEKARLATLEMEIKITGEGEKLEFVKDTFKQVTDKIRKELEYGIALGSIVIKPYVTMGPDNKYKIKFNFVKATNFYPLSFSADGEMTAAAFLDWIIKKDKIYYKFEVHKVENNILTVENKVFVNEYAGKVVTPSTKTKLLGEPVNITSVPEWASIPPITQIDNIDTLLFAYIKNPEANTIDLDSPLGISGFARASNLIKHADEQYSNLLWEFEGGQLAVDVDRTALNPMRDANGQEKEILPKLQDRLFRRNLDLGEDDMYNVFSPALRDASILNGLNNILMHIEDACSLSRGTISDVAISEARTATELKILKQRAFAANADIQKELENAFVKVFKIIDVYSELYGIATNGSYEVSYNWDDSILVDKDAERQLDIMDVDKGLMSKLEYRMKWKGETETQALESLKRIDDEQREKIELQQEAFAATHPFDDMNNQQAMNQKKDDTKGKEQEKQDKLNRANDSRETVKNK